MGAPKANSKYTKALCAQLLSLSDSEEVLPTLISTVQDSDSSSIREAIAALQVYFLSGFRKGKLSTLARSASHENEESKQQSWLRLQYRNYINALMTVIAHRDLSHALKNFTMDCIMEFVKEESPGRFSNGPFIQLCQILTSLNEEELLILINRMKEEYFCYSDVRCMLYSNLERIVDQRIKAEERKKMPLHTNLQELSTVIHKILEAFPPPPPLPKSSMIETDSSQPVKKPVKRLANPMNEEESTDLKLWSQLPLVVAEQVQTKKRTKKTIDAAEEELANSASVSKFEAKNERKLLQMCWLKFLHLPLTHQTYKKVLSTLASRLIPYMSSPILLSDFFTDSYNRGGVIAVMALTGLLNLMTRHGLEYPSFYNKLYALLDAQLFLAKHRASFFQLLDMCLNSSHLPSYLAAAFAKKVSRLALVGPPSGALVAIALVHNLLRRHPSINVLVHRQPDINTDDGDITEKDTTDPLITKLMGVDPFDPLEPDTAKCRALESSLWELETLRNHYCPAVSRFVSSLETDLTERAKTSEVNIADFSSGSFLTILSEEAGRRLKQVPLAFYNTAPNVLFLEDSSDFLGWNFGNA